MSMTRVSIVCALLLLIPGVAAGVEVPNQVVGSQVLVQVTDIDMTASPTPTKLVMSIGTGSAAVTEHSLSGLGTSTTTGAATFVALGQAGLVPWTLEQHSASGATTLAQGQVFVQDAFSGIDAAIAAVKADVSALSGKVTGLEAAASEASTASQLTELRAELDALEAAIANVGSAVEAFEETNFTKVLQAAAPPSDDDEDPVVAAPSTLSVVGTATNVTLAIAIVVLVAIMQWQSRKRHQEAMVFMLAMAAKMKVTPDSPEFQTAVAALED